MSQGNDRAADGDMLIVESVPRPSDNNPDNHDSLVPVVGSSRRRYAFGLCAACIVIIVVLATSLSLSLRATDASGSPSPSPLLPASNVIAIQDNTPPGTASSMFIVANGTLEQLRDSGAGVVLRRLVRDVVAASVSFTFPDPHIVALYYPATDEVINVDESDSINDPLPPLNSTAVRRRVLHYVPQPLLWVRRLTIVDKRMVVFIRISQLGITRAQEVASAVAALQALTSVPAPIADIITTARAEFVANWTAAVGGDASSISLSVLGVGHLEISQSSTATPSASVSGTASPSASVSGTATPSASVSGTATLSATGSGTMSMTATTTSTLVLTASRTSTQTPSVSATSTATSSSSTSVTPTPTQTSSATFDPAAPVPQPLPIIIMGAYGVCVTWANGTVGSLMKCWGDNQYGNAGYPAGTGTNNLIKTPASVDYVPLGGEIKYWNSGSLHTCVVYVNESMKCFGYNVYGQQGYGHTSSVYLPHSNFVNVGLIDYLAIGYQHFTCAVYTNTSVKCWGNGAQGQLGYGQSTSRTSPDQVGFVSLGAPYRQFMAAGHHCCVVYLNDSVKCWGDNSNGQLGQGSSTGINSPSKSSFLPLGTGIKRLHPTYQGMCVEYYNRSIKCWGNNDQGQLGINSTTSKFDSPSKVPFIDFGEGFVEFAPGYSHSCALYVGGNIKCWGQGVYGQLGYGNVNNVRSPEAVGFVPVGAPVVMVKPSYYNTCVVLEDGCVKCWGGNTYGQLGNNRTSTTPLSYAANATCVDIPPLYV